MGNRTFRILAIDGGGIRGAFVASFLAEAERKLGRRVSEHFDLLAGTSTGGIIATALAMGISAETIEQLYLRDGAAIFARPRPMHLARPLDWTIQRFAKSLDSAWLRRSKYGSAPLTAALERVFGNRTLSEATRRLVIPAVDLAKGKTVVFKTPHLPGMERDRDFRAVDVVLATTAAPSYFPPAVIGVGSVYCDGGLWANNPAVVAIVEAMRIRRECHRPGVDKAFDLDDIRVLSIGTGEHPYYVKPAATRPPGLAFWGSCLFEVMGASQSQGFGFLADHMLGPERCTRISFPLQDTSWKLDSIEHLERLLHIGRESAIASLGDLTQRFLSEPAPAFAPFPRVREGGMVV